MHRNHIQRLTPKQCPGIEISIDLIGPLPRSTAGNTYILSIIDDYTRHLELCPLNSITTNKIINALIQYFARYGIPSALRSDNGPQLTSNEFKNFLKGLGITQKLTSIYKPSSNASIERANKTIKQSLAAMAEKDFYWENKALFFKLQYNATTNRATNFSPALLFFGRDIKIPLTQQLPVHSEENQAKYVQRILTNAEEMKRKVREQEKKIMKEYEKINLKRTQEKFQMGDTVYMKQFKNHGVFKQKFTGPYTIIEIKKRNNYVVRDKYNPDYTPIKINAEKLFKSPPPRENLETPEMNNSMQSPVTGTKELRSRKISITQE